MTIFAPNDKAFAAWGDGTTLDALRKDPDKLHEFLGQFIPRGRFAVGKLPYSSLALPAITDLNGIPIKEIFIDCRAGGCNLGGE